MISNGPLWGGGEETGETCGNELVEYAVIELAWTMEPAEVEALVEVEAEVEAEYEAEAEA